MSEIILHPTETVYGLGVNTFSAEAWQQLCVLKGRSASQAASWLVRDGEPSTVVRCVGEGVEVLRQGSIKM